MKIEIQSSIGDCAVVIEAQSKTSGEKLAYTLAAKQLLYHDIATTLFNKKNSVFTRKTPFSDVLADGVKAEIAKQFEPIFENVVITTSKAPEAKPNEIAKLKAMTADEILAWHSQNAIKAQTPAKSSPEPKMED